MVMNTRFNLTMHFKNTFSCLCQVANVWTLDMWCDLPAFFPDLHAQPAKFVGLRRSEFWVIKSPSRSNVSSSLMHAAIMHSGAFDY